METAEITFKIIEIALAILGLVLIVFGWIVPYQQSKKVEEGRREYDRELEQIRWEKEFVDMQISQLYGPIYALILEGDVLFSRILYQLGRKTVFRDGQEFLDLPEEEQKIWRHYVDTYKIKSQLKMVEIFRSNVHLVYKSEIPSSYKVFLDYSLGWEMLDNQVRNDVPNYYGYHYIHNYPREFNKYIKETLKLLQIKQNDLLQLERKSYPSTAW